MRTPRRASVLVEEGESASSGAGRSLVWFGVLIWWRVGAVPNSHKTLRFPATVTDPAGAVVAGAAVAAGNSGPEHNFELVGTGEQFL